MNPDFDFSFLKKRTTLIERLAKSNRPEKLLLISFLFIIFLGSVLLSMPFTNIQKPAPYLDNLFVSVSAVCVLSEPATAYPRRRLISASDDMLTPPIPMKNIDLTSRMIFPIAAGP